MRLALVFVVVHHALVQLRIHTKNEKNEKNRQKKGLQGVPPETEIDFSKGNVTRNPAAIEVKNKKKNETLDHEGLD